MGEEWGLGNEGWGWSRWELKLFGVRVKEGGGDKIRSEFRHCTCMLVPLG